MIARLWRGIVEVDQAKAYVDHLSQDTLPQLRAIDGFAGADVLSRDVDDGIEFVVITRWRALADIHAFAGVDPALAVVPAAAQAMMVRFDERVSHYEMADLFE